MAVTSLTGFSLVLAGGHSLSVLSGARTLPIVFAPPYEPPVRRPLLVLGADPPVGVVGFVVLVVGTATGAVWFAGVVVRTLARPAS